jgi:diguanylate cyclase (GGDEF)-like protein
MGGKTVKARSVASSPNYVSFLTVLLHDATYALALALPASATAWFSRRPAGRGRPLCLAPSFVVAAAVVLPAPYALVVAAAALLASGGTGLGGGAATGAAAAISGAAGGMAAQAAAGLVPHLPPVAAAAVVYGALTGTLLAVEALLGAPRVPGRELVYELTNLFAAAVLADVVRDGDRPTLACLLTLLVVAAYALSKLAGALSELKRANDALAARISELATLHAIGRELLATIDPERIVAIVERECRKVFEVDSFLLGIVDRDTNELGGRDPVAAVGTALASWILREKRAVHIDDASGATGGSPSPFRPPLAEGTVGSILAAPLLVGERAVGILALHNRRPHAYDDHELSVLATIAHQAATAVENAHRYTSATIDSMTGLWLRDEFLRRFEDEYVRAKRYAGTFSVLMLDLDGFKDLNERQGHGGGDRYLRELGAVIKSRLRAADVGCRYGGDEMCILLPQTDLDGAGPLAERLRQDVARLVVDVSGVPVRTTASIGIASYPGHDTGAAKGLLLRADQALYKAKRAGRNRVVPFAA